MSVLFVFVDGLGFGSMDPNQNPVASPDLSFLAPALAPAGGPPAMGEMAEVTVAGRPVFVTSADACLGVRGVPQSATGQTTLLTGINAPAFVGEHASAYPLDRLKALLEASSLFARGVRAGRRVTFLNMFRPEGLKLILEGTRRASATTAAALGAGLALRTLDDLLRGEAVYHDVTCWTLQEQPYYVPLVTPDQAARRALAVAGVHDFCLYEYFLTDFAGHSQELDFSRRILGTLDEFLTRTLIDLDDDRGDDLTVVLSSDHGNVEDLSTPAHTCNPVPVLAFGKRAAEAVKGVTNIAAVAGRLAALAGIPGVP